MRLRYLFISAFLFLILPVPSSYQGQAADGSFAQCPALIQTVFAELDQNCGGLQRNNACYGFQQVQAAFNEAMPDDYFTHPSDLAPLSLIDTIQTLPLDPANNNWGIALMKAQANLPDTVPGQSVVFVLMGDVEVENRVNEDDIWRPLDPLPVTARVNANIRSGPGTNWNVIGGLDVGAEMEADAVSPDGEWLRIAYENRAAWVNLDIVDVADITRDLPVADHTTRTPMQMFYFRTGFGDLACAGAPNQLIIQGPEHVTINLNVNGADLSIGSTIAFRQVDADTAQLSVLEGAAYLNGGSMVVPAGFTVTAPLDPVDSTVVGAWTEFRALTAEELTNMQPVQILPGALLNYPIIVPTEADIQAAIEALPDRMPEPIMQAAPNNSSNNGSGDDDDDDNNNGGGGNSGVGNGNGGGNSGVGNGNGGGNGTGNEGNGNGPGGNNGNGNGGGNGDDDESSGSGSHSGSGPRRR